MPKKVLPSPEDFSFLDHELKKQGFRRISKREVGKQFRHLSLRPPRARRRSGREVGYVFDSNGLRVWVWTTWLADEGHARESDSAWVLISCDDEAVYYDTPTHRTKNFVKTLINRAWIAKWRVESRPNCDKCGRFMKVTNHRGRPKSRFWVCENTHEHSDGKRVWRSWDLDGEMPLKAQSFVDKHRRKASKYRERRRKEGKPVNVAMSKRHPWHRRSSSTK
jgi:hypothetical protein